MKLEHWNSFKKNWNGNDFILMDFHLPLFSQDNCSINCHDPFIPIKATINWAKLYKSWLDSAIKTQDNINKSCESCIIFIKPIQFY